jgi:cell wall-associated NlpC family hydrolase
MISSEIATNLANLKEWLAKVDKGVNPASLPTQSNQVWESQLPSLSKGIDLDFERKALVQVESPTTWLHHSDKLDSRFIEVSYATRLPLLARRDGAVKVATLHGDKWLNARDASVYRSESAIPKPTGKWLVDSAKKFLRLPYLWAGTSGFGFDCSGFTYTVHRAHGITIPRDTVTREQLENPKLAGGRAVRRYANLRHGDLLYFAYESGAGYIHHVGMYVGNGKMIHSPNPSRRVEIVNIDRSGWIKEYAGAIRYY